jgi:hypothetical protein
MADDYPPVPSIADVRASELLRTGFRAGPSIADVAHSLGLLAELQGNWRGNGFNITARPFFQSTPPFFLELNATQETLDFTAISGGIPNRGSRQPDIHLHGLRYLQQVTDVVTNSGIHIEPGLWLHVPATDVPAADETYVRQATIPHGDSLAAQSTFTDQVAGDPPIHPVNSTPFRDATIPGLNEDPADPVTDHLYLAQYVDGPLPAIGMPPGLDPVATIKDPTLVLKAQIARQTIVSTVVIAISTAAPAGGILNIPFVTKNANAAQLDAIFWVEKVRHPNGHHFMQLQYVQRVILDFIGIHWPHFSVATLVRI